ncbi:C2H2 finger domain protein [Microdochium trichocladiopsis]|uniref:C2H2 finger domain protein n=1 Tax=Microdochium trichocladiopsis TaxID=1682393 RepID=A0A9P8XTZ7_9PEZI|nr:C2H2 finger domain protein [Microdochium trichocladiopsis]KAH7012484.1 C2H2 finger domain protein [Microdochium trichocladiopsis]
MPRRQRSRKDEYDSDDSFSPEDVFDVDEEASDAESDITEVDPFDDVDCHVDVEDLADLLGAAHPPEFYQRIAEQVDDSDLDTQDYSPGTERLLDAVEDHWQRFCRGNGFGDPCRRLKSIYLGILVSFFTWRLDLKTGKDDRKIKGIKTASSLGTNWKVFRLVYEKAVGAKLDPKLNRQMHKVLRRLAKDYKLSTKKRENRCMTIDDLKEQIETTVSTPEKSFDLGELRILMVLFLLLLAPAGSRPMAILRLRFGDIRVVLARDPEGGPHKLLLQFTPEFTKTYLGTKDAKTFTVPETLFDPTLLLSPDAFLLGILFRHRAFRAFRAPDFVSASQLVGLDIYPGERELRLPLRRDLDDVPLFRRAVKTLTGFEMSPTEPITYSMMAGWIKKIGELLGRLYPTICYNLRYNAGNELDGSPYASDAIRNLALDHNSSVPFQKHYLGRQLRLDTWAIIRGQEPQQALLKQACSIGHANSKRRPTELTAEQLASVNTDPRIRKLEEEVKRLPHRSEERQKAVRAVRSEKQRLKRALLERTKVEWTDEQAVEDIQNQLQGLGFSKSMDVDTASAPQRPAQKRLVDALTAPVDDTLEGYYRRRANLIDAIVAYCGVAEGRTARRTNVSAAKKQVPSPGSPSPEESPLKAAMLSVFIENEQERPRRCFLCIGAALTLGPDDPHVQKLTSEFYTSGDLSKHFRRRHLKLLPDNAKPRCEVCDFDLTCKMHLQSHAMKVHGTVS